MYRNNKKLFDIVEALSIYRDASRQYCAVHQENNVCKGNWKYYLNNIEPFV